MNARLKSTHPRIINLSAMKQDNNNNNTAGISSRSTYVKCPTTFAETQLQIRLLINAWRHSAHQQVLH